MRFAGKNGLAMSAIAARFSCHAEHALDVVPRTVFRSFALQRTHRFARQIFDQNRVFFMGLVSWSRGLKIKTDRTGLLVLESSQFTEFFAGNTHRHLPKN